MTEKQKKAVLLLNNLKLGYTGFSEDDYFLLLAFVVGDPDTTYIPTPLPLEKLYWEGKKYDPNYTGKVREYDPNGLFGPVICKSDK